MPGIPANITSWDDNTIWDDLQALGGCCAGIISISSNMLLCTVDYYSRFPIVKKACGLSADDDMIRAPKIMFAEFEHPKKIVSDAGTNFISNHF